MKNKFVSLLLAGAVAVSAAALLTGCGGKDFPVEIANYTIKEEPKNVVVLDAATADIMSYIGYDRKFSGRSSEVTQQALSAAPIVGAAAAPDVDKISDVGADLVFANDTLVQDAQTKLDQRKILTIKLQEANSLAEVKTNYETIGKILGGKDTGLKEATDAYNSFAEELDKQKRGVSAGEGAAKPTICYLYTKNGKLAPMTAGHFGNVLMEYTDCVITANSPEWDINEDKGFQGVNPNFIFYADDDTLELIKKDADLSKSLAFKESKMMQLPLDSLCRPGQTAIDTLKTMNSFIYGNVSAPAATEAATGATQPATQAASQPATQPATQTASQPATQPATQAATEAAKDVSGDYGIELDGLSLEKEDDNEDVMAMQQRLEDLGYLNKADENVTGYYGEVSEKAVAAFQKKNGIKETGKADNATLKALFMSDAKKA